MEARGHAGLVKPSRESASTWEVLRLSAAYSRPVLRGEENGPHPVVRLSDAL